MAAAASSTGGSGSAAAPNYLAAAAGNIDQNKANLLAQIGQQGSAALAAYQAAQGATAAGKTAAVKAALADAINRGATGGTAQAPGEAGALTAPVAMPFDRASAMLGADQAARQSQFAGQAAGAGAYMDEAKAAIPALQAAVQQRVIAAQQALAQKAMADQQAQQIRDLQLQQLLAKSQAPQTIGQIIAANGGAGLLGDQLYNTGAAQGAALSANPSPADFASANQTGMPTDNSPLGIVGLLGGNTPLGSGTAQSLAAQSPAGVAAQKAATEQQLQQETSQAWAKLSAALSSGRDFNSTVQVLYQQYPPAVVDSAIARWNGEQSQQRAATANAANYPTTTTTRKGG